MTHCDPAKTSAVVTAIRISAEHVRAYGGAGAGRGLVVGTPLRLHVIAALLESEMRSWTHVDETAATTFAGPNLAREVSGKAVGFPGLRTVSTIVAPPLVSAEVQIAELQSVVALLHSVLDELPVALNSAAAQNYSPMITAQIDGIAAFVAAIA